MILYIAGPMTGYPQHNYPAFMAAEEQLRRAGYAVLNPARIDELCSTQTGERTWAWYMRRAIGMVAEADGIALLPGWQDSRGAQLETHIAEQIGARLRAVNLWMEAAA